MMNQAQNLEWHKKSGLTIGLLIPGISSIYHTTIWSGIADTAFGQGANLVTFVGSAPRHPIGFRVQETIIYDLVAPENVDGLIILAGPMGGYLSEAELAAFCHRFDPLPVVTIARQVADFSAVMADNEQGMRHLMAHLIEEHGYRRFAFLSGPANNTEAVNRYQVYRDVLAEHDLPLDPDLIACGNFRVEEGKAAMESLLARHRGAFEVVVSADDGMAVGALKALQAHGVQVPDDIALVGFDDEPSSQLLTPPLTTVRQSLYKQGCLATELLIDQLHGRARPAELLLPTELVVRQSCGCLSKTIKQAAVAVNIAPSASRIQPGSDDPILVAQKKTIYDQIAKTGNLVRVGLDFEQFEQLLGAFVDELQNNGTGLFLTRLSRFLNQLADFEDGIDLAHTLISTLRRHLRPYLANDQQLTQAENLWQQARTMVGEMGRQVEVKRLFAAEAQMTTLYQVTRALSNTFEVPELLDLLAQELPRLNIPSCYLALYEDPQAPATWSRLIFAYHNHKRLALELVGQRFSSLSLMPTETLLPKRPSHVVIEPLYFRENQLGFIIFALQSAEENRSASFETGPRQGSIYYNLSRQISSALQGALAVQELEAAQTQLVQQEKLAALGVLASNIAHELRNPLGVITNSTYLLQMLLENPVDMVQEQLEIINGRIFEAEKIISALLDISRTRTAQRVEVMLADLLAEVQHDYPPPAGVSFNMQAIPTGQSIWIDRQQIKQVLSNLSLNAYQAMPEGGALTFCSEQQQDMVVLRVRDTGTGITKEAIRNIFEPLFTTKVQGIGLGLAIAKKLVEVNEGMISVESSVGVGSTFTLTLPVAAPSTDGHQ